MVLWPKEFINIDRGIDETVGRSLQGNMKATQFFTGSK